MTRYKTSLPMVDSDTGGLNFDGITSDGVGSGNLTIGNKLIIPSAASLSLASGANTVYGSGATHSIASAASLSLANGAIEVLASGASLSLAAGAVEAVATNATLSLASGASLSLASGANTVYGSGATHSIASAASLSLANGAAEVLASGASISVASGASIALANTAIESFASGATMSMASGAVMQANGNIGFGAPGTTSVSVATASGTTVPIAQAVVRVSNTAASTSGSCTLAAGAFDGQCVTIINEGGANFVVTGNMKANQTLSASSAMDLVWISTDTAWWRVN